MRPSRLDIDVDAIRHNIGVAKKYAPQSKLLAMVKANAYGHDVGLVCPAIKDNVDGFGVGFIEEAYALSALNLSKPIVIVEGFFSKEELVECSEQGFEVCVHSPLQLAYLLEASLDKPLTVWLKYDSGMHRLGLNESDFLNALEKLSQSANVKAIILTSHLACADEKEHPLTSLQIAKFNQLTTPFHLAKSLSNSAAVLTHQDAHFDIIRPGIMLYGGAPVSGMNAEDYDLKPAMQLSASVIAVREIDDGECVGYGARWQAQGRRRIATISCGYGDGYPRLLHPDAHVLIAGNKCPLAGQVSMEMITVDVTELETLAIGQRAVLWGEGLPCQEVARWVNTIDYELMTRASLRIKPQLLTK